MLVSPRGAGRCGLAERCHNISSVSQSVVIELLLPYDFNADGGNRISALIRSPAMRAEGWGARPAMAKLPTVALVAGPSAADQEQRGP